MSFATDMRRRHAGLWERMVTHPFVLELGSGALPAEKFKRYMLQDYVFVNDLVAMTAQGVAKAPDFEAASVLNSFLTGLLDPENDLFMRVFREYGVSSDEYSTATALPTTQALGDLLVRAGYEGEFVDIATVLYVTEGTYLDWGTRLADAGALPDDPFYREWIELHTPPVLGPLVAWLEGYLNGLDDPKTLHRREHRFHTALRYEYRFWEAIYHGERWPDE